MFGAIKQPNGKYAIVEIYPFRSKTFYVKDKLKVLGGRWNPESRWWEDIDETLLSQVPGGVTKRFKIRVAAHPEVSSISRDRYCYQHDIQNNQIRELTMGDDHVWVDIEEIYGEG